MSDVNKDGQGTGEKALLGVVATIGGGVLLWAITNGDSTAFWIFMMMLAWIVAGYLSPWYERIGLGPMSRWGAVATVAVVWFLSRTFD